MTDKTELRYVTLSRAWSADPQLTREYLKGRTEHNCEVFDVIYIGNYYPDGVGCEWEGMITFLRFDAEHTGVKLALYDDAWQAFAKCPQLFDQLALNAKRPGMPATDVDELEATLTNAGFKDATPTVDPATVKKSRANATA